MNSYLNHILKDMMYIYNKLINFAWDLLRVSKNFNCKPTIVDFSLKSVVEPKLDENDFITAITTTINETHR